ncbi:MAG: hypothetical protein SNJ77_04330 [Cytophagales bacterium]
MKKILFNLPIIALMGLVFLGSCGKKDEDPTGSAITLSKSNPVPNENVTVSAEILVSNIREVVLTKRLGSGAETTLDTKTYTSNQKDLRVDFGTISFDAPGTYTLTVTAYNNATPKAVLATIQQTVTVTPTVRTASAVVLGDQAASSPSYLTLTSSSIITVSSANVTNTNVDLNFVSLPTPVVATSVSHFISPDTRSAEGFTTNTGITRATFIGTTSLAYNASATDIWNASAPTTKKVSVSANTVYLFQNADGNKGLIRVSSVSGTPLGANRTVQIDVRILEQAPLPL